MDVVVIAVAAVVAGLVGAVGPRAIAPLPEPEPDGYDKTLYADLATRRGAAWVMAFVAAVSAGLVAWRLEHLELLPVWVVLAGVGAWMGYIDYYTRYLPFVLNAILFLVTWALVGLGALLLLDGAVLVRAAVGNLVYFGFFWFINWIGHRFGRTLIGYGDVRLAGVLGPALGAVSYVSLVVGIYATFVIGALLALLTLLKIHRNADGREFALGPAMLLGAVVGAVWVT